MPLGFDIELNADDTEALGHELSQVLDDLESSYSRAFDLWNVWWRWYEAEPRVRNQSWPWQNASNIVLPVIATAVDSLASRMFSAMFGATDKLWVGRTENELAQPFVQSVTDWMNYAAFHEYDLFLPTYDHLLETFVLGTGVLGLKWRKDQRWILAPGSNGKPNLVTVKRGPLVEYIPREQVLWQPGVNVQDSPIVAQEHAFSWTQLCHNTSNDESYDAEALDGLKGMGGGEGPSTRVRRDKEEREGVSTLGYDTEPHDVRVCWVDWPLLKAMGGGRFADRVTRPGKQDPDQPAPTIVVTLHRRSRRVIRKPFMDPYLLGRKPFFENTMRRRSGRPEGRGMSKILEQIQRGMSTMVNQSIDAVTRSNAMWAKTNSSRLSNETFSPDKPIYVPTGEMFELLNSPKQITSDIMLLNLLGAFAGRLSGAGEESLGQMRTAGGHPASATATLALIGQQAAMSSATKRLIWQTYAELGQSIATLYQNHDAYESSEARAMVVERALGPTDARAVRQWMFPRNPIFGNMTISLRPMDERLNPEAETQRGVRLFQLNQIYISQMLQLAQAAQQFAQQGNSPMAKIVLNSMDLHTRTYRRVLDANEVDDAERFVLEMREARGDNLAGFDRMAGAFGEIAQGLGGAVPVPPVGGVSGAAGNGATGPPTAARGFLGLQ